MKACNNKEWMEAGWCNLNKTNSYMMKGGDVLRGL